MKEAIDYVKNIRGGKQLKSDLSIIRSLLNQKQIIFLCKNAKNRREHVARILALLNATDDLHINHSQSFIRYRQGRIVFQIPSEDRWRGLDLECFAVDTLKGETE
jgi:hypothetical protein